jgi:hypothetical protein
MRNRLTRHVVPPASSKTVDSSTDRERHEQAFAHAGEPVMTSWLERAITRELSNAMTRETGHAITRETSSAITRDDKITDELIDNVQSAAATKRKKFEEPQEIAKLKTHAGSLQAVPGSTATDTRSVAGNTDDQKLAKEIKGFDDRLQEILGRASTTAAGREVSISASAKSMESDQAHQDQHATAARIVAMKQQHLVAMKKEYAQLRAELKPLGAQCDGGKLNSRDAKRFGVGEKVVRYRQLKSELAEAGVWISQSGRVR